MLRRSPLKAVSPKRAAELAEYQRAMRPCAVCATPFFRRSTLHWYCSVKCRERASDERRATGTLVCEACGQTFRRRPDQIARPSRKFCSSLCANNDPTRKANTAEVLRRRAAAKRHSKTCDRCGNQYDVIESELRRGSRFCSLTCSRAWQREQPRFGFGYLGAADNSGRRNGRWKHGKREGANVTKRAVRAAVAARDGDHCLICEKPPSGLHLHRVVYGSHGGKYEVGNCVQLCPYDHDLMHSNKKRYAPLLLGYLASPDSDTLTQLRASAIPNQATLRLKQGIRAHPAETRERGLLR